MIKASLKLAGYFILSGLILMGFTWAQFKPSIPTTLFPEGQASYRLFLGMGSFQPLLELTGNVGPTLGNFSKFQLAEHHVKVGTYFQIVPNLHVGAFYSLERGVVHDDDWIFTGTPRVDNLDANFWKWRDTSTRFEHTVSFDITPRVKLALAEQTIILDLKCEYFRHFSASNDSVKFRPGISWLLKNEVGEPAATLYLQNEIYLEFPVVALSVSQTPTTPPNAWLLYENWLYGGVLFHLHESVTLGFSLAWKQMWWREGESYLARWPEAQNNYEVKYSALVFGLQIINRIKLF